MQSPHPDTSPRRRHLLSCGVLVGLGALTTSAVFTLLQTVDVRLGAAPTFDLSVAGSGSPTWEPTASDWLPAGGASYAISSDERVLVPGESATQRVAVRNDSPEIAAAVTVRLAGRADTDRDLFDVLEFTVREPGGPLLVDGVSGEHLGDVAIDLTDPLAAGEHSLLDVTYTLPQEADPGYAGSRTIIQVGFEGENA